MKKINFKRTNDDLTEIVFILDKSGSMSGYEEDAIGGFNSTLEEQREREGRALVTTVLFSTDKTLLHDRLPIERVGRMTRASYRVGGCTALLDTVGDTIRHICSIHRYARREDLPGRTVFIIMTDGMENASRRFDQKKVSEMIRRCRERWDWEFIFLGANIDAVGVAEEIGIRGERAANFSRDCEGMRASYEVMSDAISAIRRRESLDDVDWCRKIKDDNSRRG